LLRKNVSINCKNNVLEYNIVRGINKKKKNAFSVLTRIKVFSQILNSSKPAILMQPKGAFIKFPDITTPTNLLQVLLKFEQLIILTLIERQYGDAIFQLKYVRVRRIIH
jgi:hypothetical protein